MGYYTDYQIESSSSEEAKEKLKELSDYEWCEDTLYHEKWYDWECHLGILSELYPKETLILSGVGEDLDDFWKARMKDGKIEVVYAEIIMPEFKD